MTIDGVCTFHTETGTEGGYWAVQDSKHIHPPTEENPAGLWDYDGLYTLIDNDRLTIRDRSGAQVWSGVISMREYAPFTQEASGFWIHSDQIGVEREEWARYFLEEYPATLEREGDRPLR